MKEKKELDQIAIDKITSSQTENYFLFPFICSLIAYYIFFRFHHFAYELKTTKLFFLYFGPNIILFSIVLSLLIYRYKYHIPLLKENYTLIDIKPFVNKIIISFTLKFIPIIFLLLQLFFYATNIYLSKSSFEINTIVQQSGYNFKFLAPSYWVAVSLGQDKPLFYMQTLEEHQVNSIYKVTIHDGFWVKFTDL